MQLLRFLLSSLTRCVTVWASYASVVSSSVFLLIFITGFGYHVLMTERQDCWVNVDLEKHHAGSKSHPSPIIRGEGAA